MPILPEPLDYTSKDFDSIRARVQALITSVFPTWTDFEVTNFGNILIDAFAWTMDVLTFTQDNQAQESRIVTVTQRRNLLALVKLLSYRPAGASAATVDMLFTGVGLAANVVLPAGLVIKTQSETPVEFQLLSPLTLTVAQPTATGSAEHSKTFSETSQASGQPNQKITSGQIPYLDDSSTITDTSGLWTQVDNFLDSGAADRHYTVDVDNNDRAVVTFGDGINGQLPSGTITWVYRTGGGSSGNVEAGSITKIDDTLVDVLSNTVTVTATNTLAAAGGDDREKAAVTKLKAPNSIRAPRTTIAREDYEIHALEVPGVARALMISTDQDPTVDLDTGFLYVVPAGIGFTSAVLRQKVKDRCTVTFPNPMTFLLTVAQPIYLDVGVSVKVSFSKGIDTAAKRSAVKQSIIESLRIYFEASDTNGQPNPKINFGFNLSKFDGTPSGTLPLSDLFNAVRDTEGVRKIGPLVTDFTVSATRRISTTPVGDVTVLASGSHADIPIQIRDFPRLDGEISSAPNVVVIDADTGLVVA